MSSKTKKSGKPAAKNSGPAKVDYTKLEKDTRLIKIDDWDWSRVVYSDPQTNEIPGGGGNYRRVYIQYMYDDNTIGPAIVEMGKHYCFGVQPDNEDKDGKVMKDNNGKEKALRGYRVPIVMTSQNKNNPEPEEWEQNEVDFFDGWRDEVVRYATENRKAIGKGAMKDEKIDALVSNLLYRRTNDEGEVMEDVPPKFYANLIYYSNRKEVGTTFYGPGDKEVDPLTMTSHFHIYPTIRFDSIYVGGKSISLQSRVYDATVEPASRAPKKRLARTNTAPVPEGGDDDASADVVDNDSDLMESEDDE
jgi:hypothetical protein